MKLLLLLSILTSADGFVPQPPRDTLLLGQKHRTVWRVTQDDISSSDQSLEADKTVIRALLKFIGPYPALGLRFPNLATSAQRARNVTGVALDFVLDTAANTNTINKQIADELRLDIVGQALPGIGTSGALSGGNTYMLGDTQLEGILEPSTNYDKHERFLFMQNLTASALPVASPASAGLMSLAFFYCFEGGVEFHWGGAYGATATAPTKPPTIAFYAEKGELADSVTNGLSKVKIEAVPVTQLPSIRLMINGVEIPALLDTGSPVTVLNSQAARQTGIETGTLPRQSTETKNPLEAIALRFKEAQAIAKAAADGNVLTIAGPNGPVNLLKSTSSVGIEAVGVDNNVSFGSTRIYVGDIPGLAALDGIGVDAPPAIVLGMDVLTKRSRMVLRAQDNEVYF
jgi:Aspartyl protease